MATVLTDSTTQVVWGANPYYAAQVTVQPDALIGGYDVAVAWLVNGTGELKATKHGNIRDIDATTSDVYDTEAFDVPTT